MSSTVPVVFFDGVCTLCNASVDLLMRIDRAGALRVASLQGETAASALAPSDIEPMGSIVLIDEAGTWRESTAVARILWRLGGWWNTLGWALWLVPAPIRDAAYRLVATNRYRIFGVKDVCRVPTPEERARFLP